MPTEIPETGVYSELPGNVKGLDMGDIPDSDFLPPPSGDMFEFYEGLDSNLFTESTGVNHNAPSKYLKVESTRHLEFLSYLLSIRNKQAIMSDNIVHTGAIIDNSVTTSKLEPALRDLLTSLRSENVIERNSVQTANALSLSGGKIKVKSGTVISQAGGFIATGQRDYNETLEETLIDQTTGPDTTGYLYKVVGGPYMQSLTLELPIDLTNMVGTKVYLGYFKVDSAGTVMDVQSATPVMYTRSLFEPKIVGGALGLPAGKTNERPEESQPGQIRFNNETMEFEGFKADDWDTLGGSGQMLGKAHVKAISYNSQTIEENITIKTGINASSVGDIVIQPGHSVTVEDGAVYKII